MNSIFHRVSIRKYQEILIRKGRTAFLRGRINSARFAVAETAGSMYKRKRAFGF